MEQRNATAYKIGERAATSPKRLLDKDAHDLYRLLLAVPAGELVADLRFTLGDDVAGPVTRRRSRGSANSPTCTSR